MQHLAVRAVQRAAGLEMNQLASNVKRPTARLRGFTGQRQTVKARQLGGGFGRAVPRQVFGRGHAQAPVVGHANAHQRRIGQVAHAHRAVKAFAGQIDHAVAQVQRDGHVGMLIAKLGHQRRNMAPAKTGRRGNAQVAAGLDTAGRDAGFGIGQL